MKCVNGSGKTHIFPDNSKKAYCGEHIYITGSIGQYNDWISEKSIKENTLIMCKKCVKIWRKKKKRGGA